MDLTVNEDNTHCKQHIHPNLNSHIGHCSRKMHISVKNPFDGNTTEKSKIKWLNTQMNISSNDTDIANAVMPGVPTVTEG